MIERTEKCYEGLDMWHLKMDEAYVRVKTIANEQIHFYVKSEDCVEVISCVELSFVLFLNAISSAVSL